VSPSITPQIRSLFSPDAPGFPRWEAGDPSDVAILVEVEIGEDGQPGADVFQIMLVTPKGLERMAANKREPVILDRGLVVMREATAAGFEAWLSTTVEACAADTWVATVFNLQRYFRWEYENYKMEAAPE
jgi:Immunity protein 8